MNKQPIVYSDKARKALTISHQNHHKSQLAKLITDLKLLIKAPVLIANVLPVIAGYWLALHFMNVSIHETIGIGLLVIIGSTFVMAGALVLNNWYDADIDAVMKRTKARPTVTGSFSLKAVFMIGMILSVIGFAMLLFISLEVVLYAFIGWFTYVILYTMWSKRRYTINTFIGSVSGAVTPLIGWSAVASSMHVVPVLLFAVLLIWQMPHTFAIAMRKYDEYKAANVAMLPVVRGFKVTKWQMACYVACLLPLPFFMGLGLPFIVITTLLNVIWFGIILYGLFTDHDEQFAYLSFKFSVHYLLVFFLLLIVVTLPIFQ